MSDEAIRARARDLVAEAVAKLRRAHPDLTPIDVLAVLANQCLLAIGAHEGKPSSAAEAAYCLADMLVPGAG